MKKPPNWEMLRLVSFAMKYPYSWHSYCNDGTVKYIKQAEAKGLLVHSTVTKQFRIAIPEAEFTRLSNTKI